MDSEFGEMHLNDGSGITAGEATTPVIGKVMYYGVELGSLLYHLLFRGGCWHYCWF